jgi:hypothetical protein
MPSSSRTLRWSLGACILTAIVGTSAIANVLKVSSQGKDFSSIQEAINQASAGDTVLVESGLYEENISFLGRALHLIAEDQDHSAIIRPPNLDLATIDIRGTSPEFASVVGFTLTGGSTAIYLRDANGTVRDNLITHNQNSGIVGTTSRLSGPKSIWNIVDNTISNNTARVLGGGVSVWGYAVVTIVGNNFNFNTVRAGDGGAVSAVMMGMSINIDGNRIVRNHAEDHGGGLYCDGWTTPEDNFVRVSNNLIGFNTAMGFETTGEGGGGALIRNTNAEIVNNTFLRNTSPTFAAPGGGLAIRGNGSMAVLRNIVAFTESGAGILCSSSVDQTFDRNILWSNEHRDLLGACLGDAEQSLFVNPLFCDDQGDDFLLSVSSPALQDSTGPIGAVSYPGCSYTPTEHVTWGLLKSRFRNLENGGG